MTKIVRGLSGVALWAGIVVHPAGLVAQTEPPPLPERSELVRVIDHAEEGDLEIVFGPVNLPAGGPHVRTPIQLVTLPIEGWLHGFEWEMRDASDQPLPDRLLHHVNFIDPDNRELFAPIARRVMAAGRETRRERMPKFLGYPIASGTRFLISAMFASLEEQGHDDAFLHVTLSYSPKDAGLFKPRAVYPFYLDVMGPVGEKEFPVPPGVTTMSWEGRPAIEGRIFAIGGHLHNYGEWIRLEDVTEGKIVWETEPDVNEKGEVTSVPTGKLWWRGGVKLHADHLYRITVQYDNPSDVPAMDGGMGALGGILYAPDAVWPELDRTDVAYSEDLRNTLEKPNRAHEHGHGAMEHEHGAMQESRNESEAESEKAAHEHGGARG